MRIISYLGLSTEVIVIQKCHGKLVADFREDIVAVTNALLLEGVILWEDYLYILGNSLPAIDKENILLLKIQREVKNNPVIYARFVDILSKFNLNRSKNCLDIMYAKIHGKIIILKSCSQCCIYLTSQ